MKDIRTGLELKSINGQSGCSTCRNKCFMTELMENFPLDIKTKIDILVEAIEKFSDTCKKKASDGKLKVDQDILDDMESVKAKIAELQGMTNVYSELNNAIVYVLGKHGNSILKNIFLKPDSK